MVVSVAVVVEARGVEELPVEEVGPGAGSQAPVGRSQDAGGAEGIVGEAFFDHSPGIDDCDRIEIVTQNVTGFREGAFGH